MSFEINVLPDSNYVHVVATGDASYENANEMWRSIVSTCNQLQCFKILGENRLRNGLSTMDAWKHQQIFQESGVSSKMRIAWVDQNPNTFPTTEFIGQVLSNRAMINGRLFKDVEKAKLWLLS